jgi:hypothetical protein
MDLFKDGSRVPQKFGLEPTNQPDFPVRESGRLKNVHLQEELNEIRAAAIQRQLGRVF